MRTPLLLTLGVFVLTHPASALAFSDVAEAHLNAEAIAYMQEKGIVSGYPDGTFRPERTINRAEFTKIIIGSNFTQQALDLCKGFGFTDTANDAWYTPYVCLAKQHEIIGGYPDGTFHPDAPINFAEAAKIIANVDNFYVNGVGYRDTVIDGVAVGQPLPESTDGKWYEPFVRYLALRNAIPLQVAAFDQPVTRAQMAEILFRLLADRTDKASRTYEDIAARTGLSWKTYTSPDGYAVDYPSTWFVRESVPLNETSRGMIFNQTDNQVFEGSNAVSIAVDAACPDLSHIQPTSAATPVGTYTINKRVFSTVTGSEGAAGSARIFTYYVSKLDDAHCLVIMANQFHANPEAFDEPERSQRRREVQETLNTLQSIVDSVTVPYASHMSEEKIYHQGNAELVFRQPAEWGKETQEQTQDPEGKWLWRLNLGPVCEKCAEGTDTSNFTIHASVHGAISEDDLAGVQMISDTMVGDTRVRVYDSGGICAYREALFQTAEVDFLLTGRCAADDPVLNEQFEAILASMSAKAPY